MRAVDRRSAGEEASGDGDKSRQEHESAGPAPPPAVTASVEDEVPDRVDEKCKCRSETPQQLPAEPPSAVFDEDEAGNER